MIFQNFKIAPPCPPGGRIWTNMQRAQLGPPLVHMAKFDQNRLKDLGARRVDDRHTHTHTHRHTDKPAGDDGPILPPFYSTKARIENFLSPEKFL